MGSGLRDHPIVGDKMVDLDGAWALTGSGTVQPCVLFYADMSCHVGMF